MTYDYKQLETDTINHIPKMFDGNTTLTEYGSATFLFYGEKPSEQSKMIKTGKLGEFILKRIVANSEHFELLQTGVHCIDKYRNRNKDVDLLFIDKRNKILYYRELKANISLDSEKLPVTIEKINEINAYLVENYKDYTINSGIVHWCAYDREMITSKKYISSIRSFENKLMRVEHLSDLLKILEFVWPSDELHRFFRKCGECIDTTIEMSK